MKVLIVEDEPAAARRLQKMIQEADPQAEIVGKTDSIEGTLQWLTDNGDPDLVFLDIHLADGSSFEIFNLYKLNSVVIFTTAYDEYALRAFRVNAIDYLLKPIKKEELQQALDRYYQTQDQVKIDYEILAREMSGKSNRRFLIRFGQQIRVVDINEVAYFYTQDKITFLVTFAGKRYPVDHSLEKLEEMADERKFFRINRQFIVHIDAIDEMHAFSKSRVKIELRPPSDLDTIVSTERSPHFKKWLIGE